MKRRTLFSSIGCVGFVCCNSHCNELLRVLSWLRKQVAAAVSLACGVAFVVVRTATLARNQKQPTSAHSGCHHHSLLL